MSEVENENKKKKGLWKKPKMAHRITIETKDWMCHDDDGNEITATSIEDILDSELDSDIMNDLYTYYRWLYGDEGFEIIKSEVVEIWSWKEMKGTTRFRNFYELYGDGEDLHV